VRPTYRRVVGRLAKILGFAPGSVNVAAGIGIALHAAVQPTIMVSCGVVIEDNMVVLWTLTICVIHASMVRGRGVWNRIEWTRCAFMVYDMLGGAA
tara:strand:- start:297 stop:584 length:288 start_codon:yes stop_codon:yes gene_type:complete